MKAWLLLGLGLLSATAKADPSPYLAQENPLLTLLPSAAAQKTRERERLEAQLERGLASLARVKRAQVVLRLPDLAALALDQPAPPPSANLLLDVIDVGPGDREVIALVRASLPEIDPAHIHIVRTHSAAETRDASSPAAKRAIARCAPDAPGATVRVGPFLVASESSALLRASLAACLAANVLLATLLLMRRRAR